jgi:osmotically-inducible protein OsmY
MKLTTHRKLLPRLLVSACLGLMGCHDAPNSEQVTMNNTPQTAAALGAKPDNTAQNAVDQQDAALTPMDQGHSHADRHLTEEIRRAIVNKTNDFSITAKNVKIITRDGNVTLRGPVNNEGEKTGILVIARNIAGETNVTDQLEVKYNQ